MGAPNLRVTICHRRLCSCLHTPARILRSAIVLKPSSCLHLHSLLTKRKYRLLFSPERRNRPSPKGPKKDLMIVTMKRSNPNWGCPRIAQQIALAFGVKIDKDVVRRPLNVHYRRNQTSEVLPGLRSLARQRTVYKNVIYSAANGNFQGHIGFLL